jgi:hypothetical protein
LVQLVIWQTLLETQLG